MSFLWWYKLLFMTELITAEVLFTFRLTKRRFFVWRVLAAIAVCYAVAALYPLPKSVSYSGWYASLMFLAMFAVTFCALLFVYRVSPVKLLFCAITAYTVQHLSYELFALLSDIFTLEGDMYNSGTLDFSTFSGATVVTALVYVDLYILVYALSYYIMGKRLKGNADIDPNVFLMLFGAAILLIDIVLNAFVVYISVFSREYDLIVCIYNALCCILVFFIQASMIKAKDMRLEMESLSEMLRSAKRQYELQKENIDLINIKCHDLRYQINRLAADKAIEDSQLQQINDAVSIYDATVKTGNEVLDIILTEKSLVCREKNIKITCMADGAALSFMHEGELYALFGNMIDNAIEAVSKIADEEKRYIGLNSYAVGDLISITMENYYEGVIKFASDGLPITDKSDRTYHGYGMRSIAALVGEYDGDLSVSADNGIFTLNIMLPKKRDRAVV